MLKLNNYDFEFEELFEDAPMFIDVRLADINDTLAPQKDKKDAARILSGEYQELAYAYYVLENYKEAKLYLKKAAPFTYLSSFDPELKNVFGDWNIQHRINLVILFGDVATKQKLKTVGWSLPTDNIIHQACYLYDHLLIKIGTGKVLPVEEIENALTEAKATKDKDVQQCIVPLIEAIKGLTNGDDYLWQSSIDKVIAWHADECKYGDFKEDGNAVMSLNALSMAKLGKDMHGWQCKTDSLYLPLFLIDQ
ncbi:Imm49 family immunity protein [Pseudoalteromonas sp. SG45-1]|uniref:Imm49 family immunity protein n=1 Tax=Pseudoalteromonas sp. SG45-1 TaxID=2760957 RepID=UPI001600B5A5|nr:Imm49 family immunity protein [Pseudoalteromonas sp. SG45-1]MBB1402087.1 immunity 49 family protein [Pseudoalteromonas sp. SG45-1]